MLQVRFTINQIGVQVEFFIKGAWVGVTPILKPEEHGGLNNLKDKVLAQIVKPYKVIPKGDYKEAPNMTITCV